VLHRKTWDKNAAVVGIQVAETAAASVSFSLTLTEKAEWKSVPIESPCSRLA
jgi:hypothetical protein